MILKYSLIFILFVLKYFINNGKFRVRKGQQVYNCYGRRNNRFLLMWYGFVLRENAYDSIPIRVFFLKKQKNNVFIFKKKSFC